MLANPAFAQTPAFSVNKNGTDQTVTPNTFAKITWPHEFFDTNNNFASDKFTPTVAGKYLFSVAAFCSNATSGCSVWLYKNGSSYAGGYSSNGTYTIGPIIAATSVIDMNGSTDYVEAYIVSNGNTVLGLTTHTYFTGSLLSGTNDQWSVNGSDIYYSAGNVGIATSSPGSALDVKGTLRLSGATSGYVGLVPAATAGSTTYTLPSADGSSGQVLSTNGSGTLSWATGSGSSQWTTSGSAIYYNTGNVGVGSAAPGSALDVKGTLRLSGATSGHIGLAPPAAAGSTTYTLPSADGSNGQFLTTNGTGTLSWMTSSGNSQWTTSGSNIYFNSGKVGIGTTAPAYTLDVFLSDNNFLPGIQVTNTNAGFNAQAKLQLNADGTNAQVFAQNNDLWLWNSGSGAIFFAFNSSSKAMTITNSGNVGIGTATPRGGSKLDVNGTVYVGSFASASATTVCQNGNVLSTCSSASRYKENVKPSPLGLKEVLQMKPVTFDFKNHKDNWEKHDVGFIAEDMKKINPLFVTQNAKGDIEGVRYMQLTAVNARAIQELQEQIDALKRTIEQLKTKK